MAMARVVVAFGSNEQWSIAGEESALREQYNELKGILQAVDGVHDRFFEFTGCQERADRRSEQMAMRVEDIKAMSIQGTS